jgi:Fe-S-cluster-containing dehydrogenase component
MAEGFIFNHNRCVGCRACSAACLLENRWPFTPRSIYTLNSDARPAFPVLNISLACNHCKNAICLEGCPASAYFREPSTGAILIDDSKCIGCRYCLNACPYGARTSDQGLNYTDGTPELQPYEKVSGIEYGKKWDRAGNGSPAGNARKCHFCLHRLEKGLLPQCVTTCISNANYFGDMNDKESLIYEISKQSNQVRLLEEKGTEPFVSYLL